MGGPTGGDGGKGRGKKSKSDIDAELAEITASLNLGPAEVGKRAEAAESAERREAGRAQEAKVRAAGLDDTSPPTTLITPAPPPIVPVAPEPEPDLTEAERIAARRRKGRRSTILTGGQGVLGTAKVARKTLLGQ